MKKLVVVFSLAVVLLCSFSMVSYAATVDVQMSNFAYSPNTLTINAGDTVRWTNQEDVQHTVTSGSNCQDNSVWQSSGLLSKGQTFSVTFNQAGNFPYFCIPHCSFGMTGTITVNAVSSTIPLPTASQSYTYSAKSSPVLSSDPPAAEPIGLGSITEGGNYLSLTVGLNEFAGPVDVYFLLYLPAIDPVNIYQMTSAGAFQVFSDGLAPWKSGRTASINETIFGRISRSSLPAGTYYFGLLATPAGDKSLSKYYLWLTSVVN